MNRYYRNSIVSGFVYSHEINLEFDAILPPAITSKRAVSAIAGKWRVRHDLATPSGISKPYAGFTSYFAASSIYELPKGPPHVAPVDITNKTTE